MRGNFKGMWALATMLAASAGLQSCSRSSAAESDTQDKLTWALPTQNTDGSALPATDIAKTTILWGTAPGGPYTAGSADVPAPAVSVTLPRTAPGTRCYKANVTTTAAAGAAAGQYSEEVCKTTFATPNPPANLQVQ